MSKILKAIQKAEALKIRTVKHELHETIIRETKQQYPKIRIGLSIFISFLVIGAIALSTKGLQANNNTSRGFKSVNLTQKQSINNFKPVLTHLTIKNTPELERFKKQIATLTKEIKNKNQDLTEIYSKYSNLSLLVKDISSTNEALIDKFIILTNELTDIKKSIKNNK